MCRAIRVVIGCRLLCMPDCKKHDWSLRSRVFDNMHSDWCKVCHVFSAQREGAIIAVSNCYDLLNALFITVRKQFQMIIIHCFLHFSFVGSLRHIALFVILFHYLPCVLFFTCYCRWWLMIPIVFVVFTPHCLRLLCDYCSHGLLFFYFDFTSAHVGLSVYSIVTLFIALPLICILGVVTQLESIFE